MVGMIAILSTFVSALPMPSSITPPGDATAAAYSRCRSQMIYEFAMDSGRAFSSHVRGRRSDPYTAP